MPMSYLDMLTRLGVGSAHPGGFAATLQQLSEFPLPAGSRVLEVGCGTGRTACHLARNGHTVTGLDIREEMLAKARQRAAAEKLDVTFVQGSIDALPFTNGSFNIVLAESVTNFADSSIALSEYFRVLKPGGVLYDREVMLMGDMAQEDYAEVVRFFGFHQLLSVEGWLEALTAAGFAETATKNRSMFQEHLAAESEQTPDMLQVIDGGVFMDPAIWKTSLEHDELIHKNRLNMGYALLIGTKS
ncbi:2-methoxy-6-polyprenyl-1,4-benzoquinol methylase, mitochondrial [Paenibacillus solanacearum]|uniref:2-methoxy-6-polyprenyl-1,4-benzoquinol methylase, mitochondrial n=2 Tax=Paenibacillus solanacearum TaxID=2048548 RepID=A0A916NQM9_9BACL|nr:2-methoxy-6-polyprenyl-1,4-benzoquinol methylase, mitochondrial [Paenibacillus solanacearum]